MSPGGTAALAAICGSLIGTLGSPISTWIVQRHQDRRELLAKKLLHREALYSDFITETTRLHVDALEHDVGDPKNLFATYALLSRIRLSSSAVVLENAESIVRDVIKRYSEPNLTVEQVQSMAANGNDPLREFSEICRLELESMERQT
jgi:hypothetical protein